MPLYTDQTGYTIDLSRVPRKIISLVPSQTELLSDLGLNEEVAGITKFCVHPLRWFKEKTRVGGTKNCKLEVIHQLRPDLIIANKEENTKEQVEELRQTYPVWVSDVHSLPDALEMIGAIGKITGTSSTAIALIDRIKSNFSNLSAQLPGSRIHNHQLLAAYLIWRDPYMVAGGDTFIDAMMERCGFHNIYKGVPRYPVIDIGALHAARCQLALLSSEPFPFKQKHAKELQQSLPFTKVLLVDGQMFSWYGSRLLYATSYFEKLLQHLRTV